MKLKLKYAVNDPGRDLSILFEFGFSARCENISYYLELNIITI